MAEVRDPSHLTPRDREILKDVIMTYVLSAEPVSSRSVSKHGRLGLSAATIRHVMADLEEWGYRSPRHTPSRWRRLRPGRPPRPPPAPPGPASGSGAT